MAVRIDHIRLIWEPDDSSHGEGCIARAQVSYPIGETGSRRLEWLTSGGLWGIEGATPRYRRAVEQVQEDDLRVHLRAFGIKPSDQDWARVQRVRQ